MWCRRTPVQAALNPVPPVAAPDTKALIREAAHSLLACDLLEPSYAEQMAGFFAAVFPHFDAAGAGFDPDASGASRCNPCPARCSLNLSP